ncbi:carboxylesterase [Salimicrobium jeotgali]|uniref:Alpha/beta fold hydrolase n=1 Tax=Salimicrobium jeotgali TaxID=1230341 RepID=K2FKH9_9BACI|nr:alpha/beta hydrolase [Salimicrobium jeotgali]AKG04869.1 carboxylesterase [Salimicrobium jeotgali]EKE31531.1 alpha/beta fold hydrolase [Salimicrobium jeotgali]MBM7696349.1 acetyl esterase [Salimicrobium jeotgali]
MMKKAVATTMRLFPNKERKQTMVPSEEVGDRKDFLIDTEITASEISIYYPAIHEYDPLPVYINLHGGAFIMSDKDMDDAYCRHIANHSHCAVVNINYPKAPEHPFPLPLEQIYEIWHWLKRYAPSLFLDADRFAVGGQSSGGNLAAALCLYLKEKEEEQPVLQMLAYPMLDFVTSHADKPEPDKNRAKFPQAAHFLNESYIPDPGEMGNPLASPVYARNLEGLPPALILIPEYDAFNPEGKRYATNLSQAGVMVNLHEFEDCYHAFTHLGPEQKAEEAWSLIENRLALAFYGTR